MVQDGVDVVEDVPLGDGGVAVVGAELFERPVGDVLAAVGAVFGVGVEGKPLKARHKTDDSLDSDPAGCPADRLQVRVLEFSPSTAPSHPLRVWLGFAQDDIDGEWCMTGGF